MANVAIRSGDVLRYSPPYPVDERIAWCVTRLDARRFAMMPVGQTQTVKVVNEECETVYAEWRWRWKHWGDRCASDGHIYAAFMDIPFVRSVEDAGYEAKLN